MGTAVKTHFSPQIRLNQLPNGLWRLLWLGSLRPSRENPSGYEVRAYFEWGAGGHRDLLETWLPFTLPLLRLQSLWENKALKTLGAGKRYTFTVYNHGAQIREPWKPGRPENDLLNREDYSFHGRRDLARCWVFKTDPQGELVVPAWEVLRCWYLFDTNIAPAVLAGLRHAATLPHSLRPFLHGTGFLSDGTAHYVAPRWMSDKNAKRMARLLFDPLASVRAYDIYRQLMAPALQQPETPEPIPAVLPPSDGRMIWHVTARPLSPGQSGCRRWLLLNLEQATLPDMLVHVKLARELDNRQGENKNDHDLPVKMWRDKDKPSPASVDPLPLTGAAPDPNIESAELEGFEFGDSIVQTLELELEQKPLQVSRSLHLPGDEVTVEAAGTDVAARRKSSHAGLKLEGGANDRVCIDLMQRTFAAFNAMLVAFGGRHSCSARMLTQDADRTFKVLTREGRHRHFAVLEVSIGDRYAYMIDAQRYGSEQFRLLMCRSHDYVCCSDYLFNEWFKRFPQSDGNPWEMDMAKGMVRKTLNHQPRLRQLSDDEIATQLAARLEREIVAFVSQPNGARLATMHEH